MEAIGGSRSSFGGTMRIGLSDKEIRVIIAIEVAEAIWEAILEFLGWSRLR